MKKKTIKQENIQEAQQKMSKLEFSSDCMPAWLSAHICKAGGRTKQHMATILFHNSKLKSGMCLLGFQQVCALCTLPPFFFNQASRHLHATKLYPGVNFLCQYFSLSSLLR